MSVLISFIAWLIACLAVGLTISFGVATAILLLRGEDKMRVPEDAFKDFKLACSIDPSHRLKVIDSRTGKRGITRRRYRCYDCGETFSTIELRFEFPRSRRGYDIRSTIVRAIMDEMTVEELIHEARVRRKDQLA